MNLQSLIKSQATILIMYGMTILSLILAVSCVLPWVILFPILFFIFYDIVFRLDNKNFNGRDAEEVNKSIVAASTYISYFLAFIGAFVVFVINNQKNLLSLDDLNIGKYWAISYGFIIVVLSGVSLLFIPVQYAKKHKSKKPSSSLKNCFFAVLLFEKIIITLTLYLFMVLAGRIL